MYIKTSGHLLFRESLDIQYKPSNPHDSHAVSVRRDGTVVSHVPREEPFLRASSGSLHTTFQ